jgi:hypothetical protein
MLAAVRPYSPTTSKGGIHARDTRGVFRAFRPSLPVL